MYVYKHDTNLEFYVKWNCLGLNVNFVTDNFSNSIIRFLWSLKSGDVEMDSVDPGKSVMGSWNHTDTMGHKVARGGTMFSVFSLLKQGSRTME